MIRAIVHAKLAQLPEKDKIPQFQLHKQAFKITLGRDPFALWGHSSTRENTSRILFQHAVEFAAKANLEEEESELLMPNIQAVVAETEALIPTLPRPTTINFSATLQQHQTLKQEHKTEVHQQQQVVLPSSALKSPLLPYAKEVLILSGSGIVSSQPPFCHQAAALFKSPLLPEHLYLAQNLLQTLETKAFHMKSIERFLVILETAVSKWPLGMRVIAISLDDAKEYLEQLRTSPLDHRHVALYTRTGILEAATRSSAFRRGPL